MATDRTPVPIRLRRTVVPVLVGAVGLIGASCVRVGSAGLGTDGVARAAAGTGAVWCDGLSPAASSAVLAELHAEVTVSGLEDRRFEPGTFWSVLEPYLDGPFDVEVVGTSAEGRRIHRIGYGSGPARVLLWSQMHGDESTATMALADLIRFFRERPDHPLARRIARGATVHMVPMLNPDGAARFRRRNAQGVDVNRDARDLETPEARILKTVRDAVQPDFAFNLHDQAAAVRVGDTDRQVAIALLAPPFNAVGDVDDRRLRAMQVASVVAEAVEPMVGGHIARYDDTFNPRAFGDLMAAWGASAVLIESGGWAGDPQKQYLRRVNFVAILTVLDAIATGRYAEVGTRAYHRLPPNGRRPPDLLIRGGTLAAPGLPPLRADILVEYDQPLRRQGGRIIDLGDLDGFEALDTLHVDGLFLIPLPLALDAQGGLDIGLPAHFVVAEDAGGERVRFRFEGAPPTDGDGAEPWHRSRVRSPVSAGAEPPR